MGALTEIEIFACLRENLVLAIEHCDDLASLPLKGTTYDKLRHELRLIEGCCRQASAWREDTRWLPIGKLMAEAHQKAGGWLRGYKDPLTGQRIKFAPGVQNPLFRMLADNLRGLLKAVDGLKSRPTGRVGMILPEELPGPHRDTVPVGWRPQGGLILPDSAQVA